MAFDTSADVIATLVRQGEALDPVAVRRAAGDVEQLRAEHARLDADGYQPLRLRELKAKAAAKTVEAGVALVRELDADAEAQVARDVSDHERQQRDRVARANGHAVDASWFGPSMSPAEISARLQDAVALGDDEARRAWFYAKPILDAKMRQDHREHRLPGTVSAFNVLTIWSTRIGTLRSVTREHVEQATVRRARTVREIVLQIYGTVGLRDAIERAVRRNVIEAETSPQSGGLVVGRWFDQFGSRK